MSSRVENENTQRRIEQQRQQNAKDTAKSAEGREKFAKALAQHKNEAGQTKKEGEAKGGKALKQQAAQQAVQAKAGMVARTDFNQLLNKGGEQSVKHGGEQNKSRTDNLKNNDIKRREDKTEVNRKEMRDNDRLAAIDVERRRGSEGGGAGGGDLGGDAGANAGGGGQGAQAAMQPQGAAPAQQSQASGTNAPQLPAAVLQELVKRVLMGVDAKGMGTFVVQLKDNVLGGAAVHVSAKDGHINAKFVTSDANTGRLIKASEGALSRALDRAGMSLDKLEVETRV